jgi:hypothetical protein
LRRHIEISDSVNRKVSLCASSALPGFAEWAPVKLLFSKPKSSPSSKVPDVAAQFLDELAARNSGMIMNPLGENLFPATFGPHSNTRILVLAIFVARYGPLSWLGSGQTKPLQAAKR